MKSIARVGHCNCKEAQCMQDYFSSTNRCHSAYDHIFMKILCTGHMLCYTIQQGP